MTQLTIRQEKRQARKNLSTIEKQQHAEKICQRILALTTFKNANAVAGYLAMPEEVDVQLIIEACWALDKAFYLPVTMGWQTPLLFAPYTRQTVLKKDAIGMIAPEVEPDQCLAATDLDVVVTPLVAFDKHRHRIGMGGGFYDRTFSFKKNASSESPCLLGVAFQVQYSDEEIPVNDWDVMPDAIISEIRTYGQVK